MISCLILNWACQPSSSSLRLRPPALGSPTLAISPLLYDFGDVYLASTPVAASFTLTNTGDGASSGCSAPALSGTNSADFAIVVDNCGTNGQAAFTGSCTVGVTTTPLALGVRTATLSRTCVLGGVVSTTANAITVTGVQAVVSLDVATRKFGNVATGIASDTQTFIISNTGSYPATGCSAPTLGGTNAGDFAISGDTCSTNNLAANSTCTFIVTATPTAAGARAATVTRTCTIPGAVSTTADGLTVTGQTARLSFVEQQKDGTGTIIGLTGARAVVTSPDGNYVYGAAQTDDAIEIFSRAQSTGALTHIVSFANTDADGLNGVSGLSVSPDNRHLYAASDTSNAVMALSRNLNTGALTFVASYPDSIGGVQGLVGATDIVTTPDGIAVYVASSTDNALVAFSRTASTGALTWVASYPDGIGTNDGLNGAITVATSPDGRHIYATGAGEHAVAVFSRTISTGALTFVQVHKDNVASVDGLQGARDVTVSPDGKNVYVAGNGEDKLAVFTRNETTGALTYLEVHTDNAAGVDGLDGITSVRLTPDGKFVLASGATDSGIAVFSRNQSTGALTYKEVLLDNNGAVDGYTGVTDIFISPDGRNTYAAGFTDDALAVFTNTLTKIGEPTYASYVVDGAASVTGLAGAQQIVISPDGKNAYVSGNTDDSLEVFTRDLSTGLLTWLEIHIDGVSGVDGLNGANGIAVSRDGLNVYVVGDADDAMAVFTRNPATGALTYSATLTNAGIGGTGLTTPEHVLVSPDGKNVYVASHGNDCVTVFTRNLDTGALAYSTYLQDGAGGIDGLDGARFVAMASSWNFLQAVGDVDSGMTVFTRDTDTGALTWLENHLDGVGGVDGLAGASSVAFSPDNNTVYVSGSTDDAVAVFTRDVLTGSLTYSTAFLDGAGGVDGPDGAFQVAVSRDGNRVYVTGENDNALAVFSRNLTTGALTYVEAHISGSSGVGYMSAPRGLFLPEDGNHAYCSAFTSDAAVLFDED